LLIGAGYYLVAVGAAALTLVALVGLAKLERRYPVGTVPGMAEGDGSGRESGPPEGKPGR
jgi:hypothetical protein